VTLVTLVLLGMMFLISCAHTEIVTVQDRPYNAVGDGVAFIQSQRYQVVNSRAVGALNAGFDQWDSCSDGVIANNIIDGQGVVAFGIMVIGTPGGQGV